MGKRKNRKQKKYSRLREEKDYPGAFLCLLVFDVSVSCHGWILSSRGFQETLAPWPENSTVDGYLGPRKVIMEYRSVKARRHTVKILLSRYPKKGRQVLAWQ